MMADTLYIAKWLHKECNFRENVTVPKQTIILIEHLLQKKR